MHAEEIANQFYSELDRKLICGFIGSEGCGAAVHLSSVALTFCERLKELAAPQCASTYGASSFFTGLATGRGQTVVRHRLRIRHVQLDVGPGPRQSEATGGTSEPAACTHVGRAKGQVHCAVVDTP